MIYKGFAKVDIFFLSPFPPSHSIQAKLKENEQMHSQKMMSLTARHKQELELFNNRFKSSQNHFENIFESREKSLHQRILGLENQVRNRIFQVICPLLFYTIKVRLNHAIHGGRVLWFFLLFTLALSC